MSRNNALKREAKKQKDMPEEIKTSNVVEYERNKNKLEALTFNQGRAISTAKHDSIVILTGHAGTGKTYLLSRVAGEIYRTHNDVKRIIMTRPNVEVGEKLGFLPGEMDEKFAPYMVPFQSGLIDEMGSNKFNNDMYKSLVPIPLGYMRGRTFDDAVILLDEAQNTTVEQMKMLITRIGTNARLFISGDTKQSDLGRKRNGLEWLVTEIKRQGKTIEVIDFGMEDCVRSDECKEMLDLIENAEE